MTSMLQEKLYDFQKKIKPVKCEGYKLYQRKIVSILTILLIFYSSNAKNLNTCISSKICIISIGYMSNNSEKYVQPLYYAVYKDSIYDLTNFFINKISNCSNMRIYDYLDKKTIKYFNKIVNVTPESFNKDNLSKLKFWTVLLIDCIFQLNDCKSTTFLSPYLNNKEYSKNSLVLYKINSVKLTSQNLPVQFM